MIGRWALAKPQQVNRTGWPACQAGPPSAIDFRPAWRVLRTRVRLRESEPVLEALRAEGTEESRLSKLRESRCFATLVRETQADAAEGKLAMLIENVRGDFTFIRGIGPFSAGVRAHPGFAIVHAGLRPFVPLLSGYELIECHLRELTRPIQALCGMQLRIPQPLSREGFEEFNRPYIEKLRAWGLEVDGANPVTRTNVALEVSAVAEPMLAGFFYTTPAPRDDPELGAFGRS